MRESCHAWELLTLAFWQPLGCLVSSSHQPHPLHDLTIPYPQVACRAPVLSLATFSCLVRVCSGDNRPGLGQVKGSVRKYPEIQQPGSLSARPSVRQFICCILVRQIDRHLWLRSHKLDKADYRAARTLELVCLTPLGSCRDEIGRASCRERV